MAMASARSSVLWWVAAVLCTLQPLAALAQETQYTGTPSSPCIGYRGVEGTCELSNCTTLQHDQLTSPVHTFVASHGPNCTFDQYGHKLFCCPKELSVLNSCGRSTLGENRLDDALALGSSWPWLAVMVNLSEIGTATPYITLDCHGVLISDRHVLTTVSCSSTLDFRTARVLLSAMNGQVHNNNTHSVATAVSWVGSDGLAILILEEKIDLVPNVVWPICLSLDPAADLGYMLTNFDAFSRVRGYSATLGRATQRTEALLWKFTQWQEFYLPCSASDYYNYALCPLVQSIEKCFNLQGSQGSPIVVESALTGHFYLAGITKPFTCDNETFIQNMIAVTPHVQDIYNIIQP